MEPETRYARSGDLHIAYQVLGEAELDLVVIDQWFSHVEAQWEFPPLARLLSRLASFSRLIVFDKRGTGLSDPVSIDRLPTLEEWMDDLRAVLDEAGSERTAILTGIGAAYLGLLFAATYPARTSALVLVDGYARAAWAPDYPWGLRTERLPADLERIRAQWGKGVLLDFLGPYLAGDAELRRTYARYERHSASPGAARAMVGMLYESDLRHVLGAVRVPTLVLHHIGAGRIPVEHSRYIAEHVAGAKFVELPGSENLLWAGDQEPLLAETQELLTGVRPVPEPDRVLATVLFTDIVGSTRLAAEVGDSGWRRLLDAHHTIVRRELARFRGREVKTVGDGFLATFDGPARGIRCARAIGESLGPLGIEVRAGLHTGECELIGEDVGGIAVHIGARVSAMAGASEVLVTRTVKDLVAGSGIGFEDRGRHVLKGVPGEWRIYAVHGVGR